MKKSYFNILLIIITMLIAVFFLDVYLFRNIAVWPLYLLPLLIAVWNIPKQSVYLFNIVCTFLIFHDFFNFSRIYSDTELINRLLASAVLWTITIVSLRYYRIKSKLESSEVLLSRAQELAHLGSFRMDKKSGSLYITEESSRILALDPKQDEISFEKAVDRIFEEDRLKTIEKIKEKIRAKESFEVECRLLLSDGSFKYIFSSGQPVVGRKGEVDSVIGMLMDITQQKLSVDALNQSNEKFSKIFRASPVAISISKADDGIFIDANDSFLALFGYTGKEEVIGHSAFELNLWADNNDRQKLIKDLLENGKVENFEGRFRKKSGEIGESLSSAEIIKINDKSYVLSLYLDITARKGIEDELKKSELLFRQVWENSFDGMRLIDEHGIIVKVNEAFCKMVHMYRGSLEGNVFTVIYDTDQDDKYQKGLDRISSRTVIPYTVEEFSLWNGEKRWFEVSNSILEFQKGARLLLSIFRDVTDRKNAEEELKNTVKKLEGSNKNLEEFAYVASHDLQEPLRMISNYTQLLDSKYSKDLNKNAKDYISFILSGAKRMQELIKNLLDYSRMTTQGKALETIDCESILKDILERMRISIEESGAVVIYDSLPKIKGDVIQIEQLFQNLISNAIKFRGEKEPIIQISSESKEQEWLFSVRDNGIGIDQKFKERIFVIFQRLHSQQEYPGTGIGLAFCKKIVERHGGNIWMESEKGKGTIFYFTIPK